MRTRALVNRTALSKLAGLAGSAGFALAGYGAWAVVFGNLCAQGVAALQLLATMRAPRLRLADPLLGITLKVGIMSGAQQALGTLSTRGFILAFGAVYGVHAVGLFNFALRLVEESCGLIITTLRRVTVTSFAAAKRQGLDLKPLFARGTNAIAYATAPLFLGGAAVAPDAVALLFGAQWLGAVPALQLMLCMWVVRAPRMMVNAIMVVDGHQRAMVLLGVAGLAATAMAFLASLPWGVHWTTLSYAATLTGVVFGGAAFARRTGIGGLDQIMAVHRPIIFAALMAGVVMLTRHSVLADVPAILQLSIEVVVGVVTFSALALTFDRTRIASLFRVMRPA